MSGALGARPNGAAIPSLGMRRVLEHPLAPVVASAIAGGLYLLAAPATADMAGHTFRTWLFEHGGATVWNAQWYGGHHVLGYSLLFTPAAAWLGAAAVGVVAGVAATAAFVPVVREAAAGPAGAAAAAWLFAAGVMSNVVIGRMPFTLGIALAVAAWLCATRATGRGGRAEWTAAAAVLALAAVLASPVAGAYLLLAAAARLIGGRRDDVVAVVALAAPVLAGGAALALLFPEGGPDRFVASAFWPMFAVSVAAAALLAPGRRDLRAGAVLYLVVLAVAFAVPSTFGQNALRLGVLLGPPLLVLAARPRAPRAALAACGVVLLYLQWLPAVRAVDEARGDPSTAAAFHADARRFLQRASRPGERVEVAFTRNHWEAAHLASAVPLARGWERQLDQKVNPLFYDGAGLTPARYHAWLRENAVRWVALPAAPLDYSARAEARLLQRGVPFLRPAYRSPRWRIWELRDPEPPASGRARLLAAGPNGFDVVAEGRTVVRQRYTRYWRAQGGCVREAPGGWTEVDPAGASPVRVRADFGLRPGRRGSLCRPAPVDHAG